jgi:thiol:disulfide interchange protein DsbD
LNLFGVFEVTLGGRALDAAGALASRHGASGSFFNGVLATALATPCTAPFLSVALGFAFTQSAGVIVLMFLAVGAGLAAPYVVLSWQPQWLRFLPKPGDWMERFKVFMGFPMLATAVWLTSLTTEHYGERAWWLGMFLVFLALAAWVFGAFVQRGGRRRGLGAVVAALTLATGYLWALESHLRWREPISGTAGAAVGVRHAPSGYDWQPWSAGAVVRARAEGRVVIVDFTAKWCITCNSLVKPALEKPVVIEQLRRSNAAAFVADYTTFPPEITDELARFGRAGVPLVVIYPKRADAAPLVLPDPNPVLGPGHYAGLIVEALRRAAE